MCPYSAYRFHIDRYWRIWRNARRFSAMFYLSCESVRTFFARFCCFLMHVSVLCLQIPYQKVLKNMTECSPIFCDVLFFVGDVSHLFCNMLLFFVHLRTIFESWGSFWAFQDPPRIISSIQGWFWTSKRQIGEASRTPFEGHFRYIFVKRRIFFQVFFWHRFLIIFGRPKRSSEGFPCEREHRFHFRMDLPKNIKMGPFWDPIWDHLSHKIDYGTVAKIEHENTSYETLPPPQGLRREVRSDGFRTTAIEKAYFYKGNRYSRPWGKDRQTKKAHALVSSLEFWDFGSKIDNNRILIRGVYIYTP